MRLTHSVLDRLEMIIGGWLCLAPWILDLSDAAKWSAIATGVYVILFALEDSLLPNYIEEVINLALGLFLMFSPWLFHYAMQLIACIHAVIMGGTIVLLALINVSYTAFAKEG